MTEFITGNPQGEPYPLGFQSHFFDHYMDPTEVYNAFENIATEYPNITQLIPLPNLTTGYQRKSAAIMSNDATTISPGLDPAGRICGRSNEHPAGVDDAASRPAWSLVIDTGANQETATIASIVTPNPASPAANVLLTAPLTLAHATNVAVVLRAQPPARRASALPARPV